MRSARFCTRSRSLVSFTMRAECRDLTCILIQNGADGGFVDSDQVRHTHTTHLQLTQHECPLVSLANNVYNVNVPLQVDTEADPKQFGRGHLGDVLSIDDYGVDLGQFLCRGEHNFQRFLSIKFHVVVHGPQVCIVCIHLHCGFRLDCPRQCDRKCHLHQWSPGHSEWRSRPGAQWMTGDQRGFLEGSAVERHQGGILHDFHSSPAVSCWGEKLPPTESV